VRVFVDAAIVKPELGGIATYVAGVVRGLAAQPDISVSVATSAPERLAGVGDVEVVALAESVRGFAKRVAWRERALPGLLRAHNADVLLAPTVELPARRLPVPSMMVVHDLGPLQAPGFYGWGRWLRYAAGVGPACRRADHVVCVSNATLLQLRAAIGKIATPCSVVGEAGRTLPALERAPSAPPYVLTVGAMLEHKNIETLVRAFDRPGLAGVELHLAGPLDAAERKRLDGWRAAAERPERIIHHGFVDLPTLARLYAQASVVALPSLFEGFGLPMLEAMRAGVPVVASSIAALREVGGQAAVYVEEPLDPAAWAEALSSVLFDPERAGAMERASRERARGVSWEAIGERLAEMMREMIRGLAPVRA
jgi:glycosyltransferase involved in cell wall biosynthesis